MSQKSFSIDVNPDVLLWARTTAGCTTDTVAKRLRVSEKAINDWENGSKSPSWQSLAKLARFYHRPLAALLLPEAPDEPDLPPDFRKLRENQKSLSSKTLLAIRTARWLQGRAIELRQELQLAAPFSGKRIRTSDGAETAAATTRDVLGIDLNQQKGWSNVGEAYKRWKASVEDLGILVFQFRFPIAEVRGFSLFNSECPVIIVNESDLPAARIFTLFHELGHLLLRKPGICLPQESPDSADASVEPYCNRFAASLLIPTSEIESWNVKANSPQDVLENELRELATRYGVSKYVALGRVRTIRRISDHTYRHVFTHWKNQDESRANRPRKPGGGGQPAAAICLRQRGRPFVSMILEATHRGLITSRDAINFLNVKVADLNKLQTKIGS